MGKLTKRRPKKFFFAIVLALVIIGIIGITVAQADRFQDEPLETLESASIIVQIATNDEYSHVQAIWGDRTMWLSSGVENHLQPHRSGRYVVWTRVIDGRGQIERYDLYTGALIQLTKNGTYQKPRVNRKGNVVWETWKDDIWQVEYFDGISIHQIEPGAIGINPDISETEIIYATRQADSDWQTKKLDLVTKEISLIQSGASAKLGQFDPEGNLIFPNNPTENIVTEESNSNIAEKASQVINTLIGKPKPDEDSNVGVFAEN